MIEYPGFFACPTWRYGEGLTTFADRTPMESGWVRQRKRWLDNYVTIELAFKMSALDFSIWQSWININGYNWFRIPLDRFQGAKTPRDIRFITPVQYGYDDWGNVVATATAEVSNVKPNPPPIPPWLGDTLLECRPYNCSSYVDWLIEIGQLENYSGGLASKVSSDPDPVPYPFSEVASPYPGADGKWPFFNNIISSAVPVVGYAAGGPGTNLMSLDSFTNEIDGPQFCDGEITVMGAMNASNGLGTKGAINPNALNGSGSGAWGDWGIEAAIMQLDIDSPPISLNGNIMRNSGKNWSYLFRGQTWNQQDPGPLGVSLSTVDNVAGDVQLVAYINNNNAVLPDANTSVTIPGAANRLNMFSGFISSTPPFQVRLDDNRFYVCRDVTVIASYAGESVSLTHRQVYPWSFTPSEFEGTFEVFGPYYPTGSARYFAYGMAFYNVTCNFASFMGGLATEDRTAEAYWSWEQNFASYTPPDYCGSV